MKTDVKAFLESDLLERYLLGDTTDQEELQITHFMATYPEVRKQYNTLQEDLENYARSFAIPAPEDVKEKLINDFSVKYEVRSFRWYFVAASVAAIVFAASTLMLWNKNTMLMNENEIVSNEILSLKEDIVTTNVKLEDIKNQFVVLNNPETRKYVIRGNQNARNLQTVAYINPVEKLSLINVISLPELPEEKVYQMWADVNGEMVSLGVLKQSDNRLLSIPFKENAKSYNITIEPKGGNVQATVENIVANVSFE